MATRRRKRRRSLNDSDPGFYVPPVDTAHLSHLDIPDLLHKVPRKWPDLGGTAELVAFAFEGGDATGVVDPLVMATPLSPSTFDPTQFADQLFLVDLITATFPVRVGARATKLDTNFLSRLLSKPPSDRQDILARQEVFRELDVHKELREQTVGLFELVTALRTGLSLSASDGASTIRRKVELLRLLQQTIDRMADGFDTPSALGRLRKCGQALKSTDRYTELANLLTYEANRATVDVRLSLGAEGEIRKLHVLSQEEASLAQLPHPIVRWYHRIAAFFAGHRYGGHEVMLGLIDRVFAPLVDDLVMCLSLLGGLQFYLAGVSFKEEAERRGLEVCLPEIATGESPARELRGLFNPLLFLQDVTPIPADLPPHRSDTLVVLTGPNSGGKTRLLQAVGIAQVFGQAGLYVPASAGLVGVCPKLFLSMSFEDDAEQSEGRLGTELQRVRTLFEQLEPGSLAAVDELCSGTNPTEGEAIFEMVVSLLPRLGCQVFVSTHFLGLAKRIAEQSTPQVRFLQVDLDERENPTYQFKGGVAETSLAHRVAERLGVTQEKLTELIDDKLAIPKSEG